MTMTMDERASVAELNDLTTGEILHGVLAFTRQRYFPEQAVYWLARKMVERDPRMSSRFGLMGRHGYYASGLLEQSLHLFCRSRAIRLHFATEPRTYETIEACEPCISFLIHRGILPSSPKEKLLRSLAAEFDSIVVNREFLPTP